MALTSGQVKAMIDGILSRYRSATSAPGPSLVPAALTAGKLYEAWILVTVLDQLRSAEGYSVLLRRGTKVTLKSSPGPINRGYPFFELTAPGRAPIEIWTDVEFTTLSFARRPAVTPPRRCDYHELDILAVEAGTTGRPSHDKVLIGVECKNMKYTKDLLRAILGVRRELSLVRSPSRTSFRAWPRATVPASPPSCLVAYCTDPDVVLYADPQDMFGIDFIYEPLP